MFDEIWFACMALKWLGKGIKAVRCAHPYCNPQACTHLAGMI
jgi:hypothetical protein